jgi:two-component system, NarL family, nitrate/nitrite response regulator NarL
MPKKRVLLVDDNSAVRSLVRRLFELEPDFEISGEAENGRDAVERAENLKPDLIILDLSMPVMTGLDAAPLLRKLLPNARIILFTVQDGREIERLARAAGANSVVSKNQAASELILQARALLASIEQEHDPAKLPNDSKGLDTPVARKRSSKLTHVRVVRRPNSE